MNYISDIKVAAMPSKTVTRLRILWAAIKHLFTGQGMYLMAGVSIHVGEPGITAEAWMKKNEDTPWAHWCVSFDGEEPKGYVDGTLKEKK